MSDITLLNVAIAPVVDGKVVNELNTIGMYSMVSVLERAGYDVGFQEFFFDHTKGLEDELARFMEPVKTSGPIVGIGSHSCHMPFVVMAVRRIKELYPDKQVILGNVGPTVIAPELINEFPWIDNIALGESEHTILEIMERGGKSLAGIPGMCYRGDDGKAVFGPPRPRIMDLDTLPLPAYHRLAFDTYTQPMIMTTRGCPYACPFCSVGQFWGRTIAYRSAESVVEEVKMLEDKYGVRSIFFADPTFVLNKKRIFEMCQMIRDRKLKSSLKIFGRFDLMDEEIMAEMTRSNFNFVFFGMETGSQDILPKIKKGFTVESALETIRLAKKYFDKIEVSFMWGYPFETLDDFQKTIDTLLYLRDELGIVTQYTWLWPYRGTRLYDDYKDQLFFPEELSLIAKDQKAYDEVVSSIKKYGELFYTITNRWMIASAHMVSLAKELIVDHPNMFSDYYKLHSPDLEKKMEIAQKISAH